MKGKKDLTLTILENENSTPVWVGAGDYVNPLNQETIEDEKEREDQMDFNKRIENKYGEPPYKVLEIIKSRHGTHIVIGEGGCGIYHKSRFMA